jgi:hypothetical protein
MRLIPRHRNHRRRFRIAISQEEIAADLHYPARRPGIAGTAGATRRRGR